MNGNPLNRRELLRTIRGAGVGLALAPLASGAPEEEDVLPAEDLMREHGVLNRLLLIYEEAIRRLTARQDFAPRILSEAVGIIRRFVEEYHEKSEEESLFPRFEMAGKLVDLVAVLRQQHQAGRRVTAEIERLAGRLTFAESRHADRSQLSDAMRLFIRMYRPHEAREDTVLFPAFRSLVSKKEYEDLGDAFEEKEHRLFGKDGFEKIVAEVAGLEKELGIYELSRFTPKLPRSAGGR
jgi:hemerythrin-like domain-containing protein